MKKRWYSTEQIVAALKQVELGLPIIDGRSNAGLESDQVRERRQVVEESAL